MKAIDTGKCQLLAVELPENAFDIELVGHVLVYYQPGAHDFYVGGLPRGSYTIIGRANEITEEQAREIVERVHIDETPDWFPTFRDYINGGKETKKPGERSIILGFDTALSSFRSLCEAYGITNELILKVNG